MLIDDPQPDEEMTPEDTEGATDHEAEQTPESDPDPVLNADAEENNADQEGIFTEGIVEFENRFFSRVEGCYFKELEDTGDPVMIMPLEEGEVSLRLPGIVHELDLKPASHDSRMLHTIVAALNYVRGIREGDPIPTELGSGRASWDVSEKDRKTAHNRITMQLVSWMSGDEHLVTEPEELAQIVEDPATREKINNAFGQAAEALGLDRDQREDVIHLVANLAEELAYIETLRGQLHRIEGIHEMIQELSIKYKAEMSVMETIQPVLRLFKIALDGLHNSFDEVDAQTGEILAVLKNIAAQTKFIRTSRDDLHRRLWAWGPQIVAWEATIVKRSPHNENLLDNIYRFLAQRFLPTQEWELFTKAQENQKKLSTQKIW